MDVFELSEVNFGLILDGRRSAQEYDPDDFVAEWAKGVKILKRPKSLKEDLAKVCSPKMLNDAHRAVEKMNGLGDSFDWHGELIKAKRMYDLGGVLMKTGEKLRANDDVDLLPVYGDITSSVAGQTIGLSIASQIDYSTYKPFMPLGYEPIDKLIGGIPTDGPIVVYGSQSTGKSFWGANAIDKFLHQHKKKTAGIYTLEMGAEHYMYRSVKMYPGLKDVLDNLYISGSVRSTEELIAEVTTKRLDFVVIDDMDRIVKSVEPAAYQIAYFRLAEICRFLKIPIVILAQPNRAAKLGDKFLGPFDISWSSAGENSAAMLIALQKANSLDLSDDMFPTEDDDHYYMIFWKSRDGWPIQQGPGAIRLDNANRNQLWSGTPYKNKLWTPGYKEKKIRKEK